MKVILVRRISTPIATTLILKLLLALSTVFGLVPEHQWISPMNDEAWLEKVCTETNQHQIVLGRNSPLVGAFLEFFDLNSFCIVAE